MVHHSPIHLKVKTLLKTQIFLTIRREINGRNVKVLGIFNSSVQTRGKKKNKALKSTRNDEESDGSQEEDNLASDKVAFYGTLVSGNHLFMQGHSGAVTIDVVYLSMKSYTIAIDNKSATSSVCDSESDCGAESKKDDESLQEVYEKMYS